MISGMPGGYTLQRVFFKRRLPSGLAEAPAQLFVLHGRVPLKARSAPTARPDPRPSARQLAHSQAQLKGEGQEIPATHEGTYLRFGAKRIKAFGQLQSMALGAPKMQVLSSRTALIGRMVL